MWNQGVLEPSGNMFLSQAFMVLKHDFWYCCGPQPSQVLHQAIQVADASGVPGLSDSTPRLLVCGAGPAERTGTCLQDDKACASSLVSAWRSVVFLNNWMIEALNRHQCETQRDLTLTHSHQMGSCSTLRSPTSPCSTQLFSLEWNGVPRPALSTLQMTINVWCTTPSSDGISLVFNGRACYSLSISQ